MPPEFPSAIETFVKQVRAHSPQCKIILFPWWVPHGPKATNEGVMEVFQSCVEQAKQQAIWVATTGPAFKAAELDRADLQITKSRTDAHPGKHGAYLNACSLFAILTDKTPVGLPASLTVTSESEKTKSFEIAHDEAKYLQELAWKIYQRERAQTRPGEKR